MSEEIQALALGFPVYAFACQEKSDGYAPNQRQRPVQNVVDSWSENGCAW
jgi:hypothetical protein